MKKALVSIASVIMLLVAASGSWADFTATIDDSTNGANTFWGGTVQGTLPSQDVLGAGRFDVDSMTIAITGTQMTVTLQGAYFNHLSDSDIALHAMPGDLYINPTGWNPTGTVPHYADNTFSSTEGWKYVVGAGFAGFGVYILNTALPSFQETSDGSQYTTYRSAQAWMGGYGGTAMLTGASLTPDKMVYTIPDISGLGLGSTTGFHWTQECGNDVVEGSVSNPVPIPPTILLLSTGLLGLVGVRRKLRK